jgi:hypothetical protein
VALVLLGDGDVRKVHLIIAAACAVLGATAVYAADPLGMMSKGSVWSATNALKRLVAADNSPMNRFNLATGYQRTGRIEQARGLYRELLVDGQATTATSTPSRDAPSRVFNVADEAASRLVYLDWMSSEATRRVMARNQGAVSADVVGVDASTTVGGPTYGDVSDEAAKNLDRQARRRASY